MSHGGGGGDKCEPNLTPLLDVVLQLLMFFMITVNFVSEQVNENIKLPTAQSARPMKKTIVDVLYLNLNSEGLLEVPGKERPLGMGEWGSYLKQAFEDAARLDRDRGGSGTVRTTVVIRGDRDNDYKQVYNLMQACKRVGYRNLQLRAMTQG